MKNLIHISKTEELPSILDVIHDCRFDKDQMNLDPVTSDLKIDFYRETSGKRKIINKFLFIKKVLVPEMKYTLTISHAENYQVEEGTQGSEDFDYFNIITFDEEQKKIWISTIIAKGISVKVRDFNISIQETGEVVEEKTRFSIFP